MLQTDERADRLYPKYPLVGVAGVVWDGERVLLEKRGRPPAQGVWALPGGLIELGESAAEALRREVQEECGIEVEVGPILGLFEPLERDQSDRIRYHFIVVDFLAYYKSGTLAVGDDAADLQWVVPDDLHQIALQPATVEMIERALCLVADSGSPQQTG